MSRNLRYNYRPDVRRTKTGFPSGQHAPNKQVMKYEKHVAGCQSEKSGQSGNHPLRRWLHSSLDLLLPPRCILCGQSSGAICICEPCKAELPWNDIQCRQCGLPLATAKDDVCGSCIQNPPPFTRTICPLRYEFPADRLVQLFKFNRQLASGRVLSHLLSEYAGRQFNDLPDVLVPVPLHSLRFIKRGFNQAYELAAYISRVLDIPLLTSSLRRHRNTPAQSGLNRKQRRKNIRDAFYWHGTTFPGNHIALVDDVMTTGTTAGECARVLKAVGAKRVDVWVTARAIPAARQ